MRLETYFEKEKLEVYTLNPSLKDLSYHQRKELFRDYIRERYQNQVVELEKTEETLQVGFEGSSIQKGIYGDKKSSSKGWKAKINIGAAGEYIQLIEHADYADSKEEKHLKKNAVHNATEEWNYFVKTILFEGQIFDVLINVRKNTKGKYSVYDVTLTETKNRRLAVAVTQQMDATFKGGKTSISIESIANDGKKVNGKHRGR